jgi:hypothetical protein
MTSENKIIINIAKDFSTHAGARYRTDGDDSGQEFYEDILKPKFNRIYKDSDGYILLDFDGSFGYASSFISEVIIRLVRDYKDKEMIKNKLKFKSDDEPLLIDYIFHKLEIAQP